MILPSQLDGLPEVRNALTVAPDGRLVSATDGAANDAATAALVIALQSFAAAGDAAHLGALVTTHLKGTKTSIVTGSRADALLLVHVDPARGTGAVEKAVNAWAHGVAAAPPPRPVVHHAAPTSTPPPRLPSAQPAGGALPARPPGTSPGFAPPSLPQAPTAAATEPRAASAPGVRDPWAMLRRALGRGLLTEAAALKYELPAAANPGRAGCEAVSRDECEQAMQALLEGVGSVMAGDGLGGARTLKDLATEHQPNLSFRWLALQWSARAAMRSGGIPAARAHVQAALTLARQLDVEARALSQWTAAEVLAHDSDSTRALAWLSESRARFERAADRWGVGQTWLTEARVLAALERPGAAAEAARAAAEMLPESDEPTVLLARLALLRDDIEGAETLVAPLRTQAAEKVRGLIAAIRGGVVNRGDVGEFLREHDAAPSQRSLRALTRIASSAPAFLQGREALAWMLLRLGKYEEAGGMFRALLSQPLSPADRASVMLGLGCIANAGKASTAPLRSVVAAGRRAGARRSASRHAPAHPPGERVRAPRPARAGGERRARRGVLRSAEQLRAPGSPRVPPQRPAHRAPRVQLRGGHGRAAVPRGPHHRRRVASGTRGRRAPRPGEEGDRRGAPHARARRRRRPAGRRARRADRERRARRDRRRPARRSRARCGRRSGSSSTGRTGSSRSTARSRPRPRRHASG